MPSINEIEAEKEKQPIRMQSRVTDKNHFNSEGLSY
jgi:hypothetical protein